MGEPLGMPEDPFEPARQTSTAVLEREGDGHAGRSSWGPRAVQPPRPQGRSSRAPSRVSQSPPWRQGLGAWARSREVPDLPDVQGDRRRRVGCRGRLTGGGGP